MPFATPISPPYEEPEFRDLAIGQYEFIDGLGRHQFVFMMPCHENGKPLEYHRPQHILQREAEAYAVVLMGKNHGANVSLVKFDPVRRVIFNY